MTFCGSGKGVNLISAKMPLKEVFWPIRVENLFLRKKGLSRRTFSPTCNGGHLQFSAEGLNARYCRQKVIFGGQK